MPKTRRKRDNTERMRDMGCAIAYYRRRRGMSQDELAGAVGISRQHMGAVESPNMNRGISLDLVFNLADALEIEPYLLFQFHSGK